MSLNLSSRSEFVGLINKINCKTGAEIGVRYGYFSEYLLKNCPSFQTYYAIDCWESNKENDDPEQSYKIAQDKLLPLNATLLKKYSLEASKIWPDYTFDFVYIDALHDYESVKADINAWFHKVKRGGILAGHDYSSDWPGVMQAVNELVEEFNLTLNLTGKDGPNNIDESQPSWFIIKE